MQDILHDFSIPSLVQAMEINVQEAWLRLGKGLGATVYTEPGLQWFISGIPFHLANGIVKTNFSSDPTSTETGFHTWLKRLALYNVPMVWLTGPSTAPVDVGTYLLAQGWMLEDSPGMAIDLHMLNEESLPSSHLTIKRVNNAEMLKTWLRVMVVGTGIPQEGLLLLDMVNKHGFDLVTDVSYYIGILNDRPVATSLLYLAGGVAGIYSVATLPEVRRQGIGRALTLAPLHEARTKGYRIGTLQSTPMGLNLYRNIGFREYCTFNAYFSPNLQENR